MRGIFLSLAVIEDQPQRMSFSGISLVSSSRQCQDTFCTCRIALLHGKSPGTKLACSTDLSPIIDGNVRHVMKCKIPKWTVEQLKLYSKQDWKAKIPLSELK